MKEMFLKLIICFFIISCGEKIREEVHERYNNGQKKIVMKFINEFSEFYDKDIERMIEKITFSEIGDTTSIIKYDYSAHSATARESTTLFNDEIDSTVIYYEDWNKKEISSEEQFKDRKPFGKWIKYWSNGQIKTFCNITDQKCQNTWTEYRTFRSVERCCNEYIEYYEDGDIAVKGEHKNGHRIGTWKKYYTPGSLLSGDRKMGHVWIHQSYDREGNLIGTDWFEDGELFNQTDKEWF